MSSSAARTAVSAWPGQSLPWSPPGARPGALPGSMAGATPAATPAADHEGEQAPARPSRARGADAHAASAKASRGIERLFFALLPPARLQADLDEATARLLAEHDAAGRRVDPRRYHLTLRFVGSFSPLPSGLVDRAIAAAARVRVDRFELPLDMAGSFPPHSPDASLPVAGGRVRRDGRRRSLWWVGCAKAPAGLLALHDALAQALAAERVRSEDLRAFVPHVTILRHADRPLPATAFKPLRWPVTGFVLMHSQVGGEHGAYAQLGRWRLGGRQAAVDPAPPESTTGASPTGASPGDA